MNYKILSILKKSFNILLNAIYPPKCMGCNNNVSYTNEFCEICWNKVEFISEPYCNRCGLPQPVQYLIEQCISCSELKPRFDQSRAVFRYNHLTKRLIKNFKFNDKTYYAKSFAQLIYNVSSNLINHCDYIIAVPMHKDNFKHRKFNHSALMAYILGKLSSKPLLKNVLIKKHLSVNQVGLSKIDRLKNLKGAFIVNQNLHKLKGKIILLVDDVMTTGATVNECAKVLKKSGVKKVFVVTVARSY